MKKDIFLQYFDEAKEHLNQISAGILSLEKSGFIKETVDIIFRHTHSLKGISKVVGVNEVVYGSHKIEDLLDELKSGTIFIEKDTVNLFLDYIDFIDNFLDAKIKSEENNVNESVITERMEELKKKEDILKNNVYLKKSEEEKSLLFDVLTVQQEMKFLEEKKEGYWSYEIIVFLKKKEFPENLKRIRKILNEFGDTIAVTGTEEQPPKGFNLGLSLLYNSKKSFEEISNILTGENFKIKEITESPEETEEIDKPMEKEAEESFEEETEDKISQESTDEIDEEKLKLTKSYIDESLEELVNITQNIISLEAESDNKELIDEIFRTFHSLKGTGGTFGLIQISKVAHELETVMELIREGKMRFSSSIVDILLEGIDSLSTIFLDAQKNKLSEDKKIPIIEKIREFLSRSKEESNVDSDEMEVSVETKDISEKQEKQILSTAAKRESETIRVNLKKLDHLVNVFEELILYKNVEEYNVKSMENIKRIVKKSSRQFQKSKEALLLNTMSLRHSEDNGLKSFMDEIGRTFKKIEILIEENFQEFQNNVSRGRFLIDELQMEILQIRMLPVSTILNQYYRLVRDLSQKKKKKISLELTGGEIELDKWILEEINDPIIHIIRNSIDHGIELPEIRVENGKPETGTISISVTQRGNQVIIEIKDDGRGIDIDKIKGVILQKGLMEKDALDRLNNHEILQFIFMPGFSTSKDVTDISGRGVGMDVVKNSLKKINGAIDLETKPGEGTTFLMKVPLTMAIRRAIFVKESDRIFAVTTDSIEEILLINNSEIEIFKDIETIRFRDKTIPLIHLGNIMRLKEEEQLRENISVIVASSVEKRVGILVEKVLYQQEIVVKNFGSMLGKIPKFSGTTVLPDGTAALVLDIPYIVDFSTDDLVKYKTEKIVIKKNKKKSKILVVEDSLITRNLYKGILESFNYDVITAFDGNEALNILKKNNVDLVITDIMMPVLDGYELTSKIKKMPKYKKLPVIIVSNKGKEEDKIKGLECGADAYIAKNDFEKNKFLNIIENLL